jgi:hypothetical protein
MIDEEEKRRALKAKADDFAWFGNREILDRLLDQTPAISDEYFNELMQIRDGMEFLHGLGRLTTRGLPWSPPLVTLEEMKASDRWYLLRGNVQVHDGLVTKRTELSAGAPDPSRDGLAAGIDGSIADVRFAIARLLGDKDGIRLNEMIELIREDADKARGKGKK